IRYRCFQSLSLPSGGNSCSSMSSSVRGLSPWIDSSASSVSSAPARRRIDAAWLTACSLSVIAVHLPQLPVLIRAVVFLGIAVPLDHPSRVAHSSEGAGGDDASPVFLDYGDYAVSQGDSGHSPTFWIVQCVVDPFQLGWVMMLPVILVCVPFDPKAFLHVTLYVAARPITQTAHRPVFCVLDMLDSITYGERWARVDELVLSPCVRLRLRIASDVHAQLVVLAPAIGHVVVVPNHTPIPAVHGSLGDRAGAVLGILDVVYAVAFGELRARVDELVYLVRRAILGCRASHLVKRRGVRLHGVLPREVLSINLGPCLGVAVLEALVVLIALFRLIDPLHLRVQLIRHPPIESLTYDLIQAVLRLVKRRHAACIWLSRCLR